MADDIAIRVDRVSKAFKLPHEKNSSVKSLFVSMFHGKRTYERQEVLKGITFEVKNGEFFGIVGRNGSGKSTLLKLLAGIYTPDKGHIRVNGKLTPFIELGVGFNPELTGRENVFLNGALLGFNRKEMEAMYQEIVEFAELERFMDQKLKNYSSGMQVRLAFSIAIRAKSDILVLDEVLAVGDEAFQRKCIDVFERYKSEKKTVVLVTHDMEVVRRFCTRAVLVDNGKLIFDGEPSAVASKYSKLNLERMKKLKGQQSSKNGLSVEIERDKQKQQVFNTGDKMKVRVSWSEALDGVSNAGVAIIKNSGEYMYGSNTLGLSKPPKSNEITYVVNLDLGPGKYYLMAGLFGQDRSEVIDFMERGPEFVINEDPDDELAGLVRLKDEWIIK